MAVNDEYIEEITIAMIDKGYLILGSNNKETAEKVAEFITTLRAELNK